MNILTKMLFNFLISKTYYDLITQARNVQVKYHPINKKYVVMVDYSKSINSERLYVIDIVKSSIINKSTVSHARNSGYDVTYAFSNELHSKKSSLGVYITKGTYHGGFSYSLVLNGLDATNSNAKRRLIIFHSNKTMRTKWSWGCLATPDSINKRIIDLMKGGCLVYVYKF